MYRWLRHGLFHLDPEQAHDVAMAGLSLSHRLGLLSRLYPPPPPKPVRLLGLEFKNPVGLAAGLDKNGDHLNALGNLGFGFVEVGTVTPKPQAGNHKPRLFRLETHQALINRMGFNNKGVDHLVEMLKQRRYSGIVGANVGKQKETPIDQAARDYRVCIEKVYLHCDYITVNISSPNTADLRQLQDRGYLKELLDELSYCRAQLTQTHQVHRPILLKIAPDWVDEDLVFALETIGASGIDGLITTNTTIDRSVIAGHPHADEPGGLSGAPVKRAANQTLKRAREVLGPHFPIIGVGGIVSGQDAAEKARLGADLIQIYTGLIYQGPALIRACVTAWPN